MAKLIVLGGLIYGGYWLYKYILAHPNIDKGNVIKTVGVIIVGLIALTKKNNTNSPKIIRTYRCRGCGREISTSFNPSESPQGRDRCHWLKAFEEGNCSLEELKQQLQALQKPRSTSSFLSLQQCEAKVKEWLQLKDLTSRQLLCDHVCRIEVTKEKTVCGIYFRQLTQNILERNE